LATRERLGERERFERVGKELEPCFLVGTLLVVPQQAPQAAIRAWLCSFLYSSAYFSALSYRNPTSAEHSSSR